MRQMATVLWRAQEDITYSNNSQSTNPATDNPPRDLIYIKAGRLYRGLPYSHATGDAASFLEYAGEPDDNGIYPISGLSWESLNGSNTTARISNDCAAAVGISWGTVGNSLVKNCTTKYMTEKYGYLRVGEYESPSDEYTWSVPVVEQNGFEVMCAAYSQLQKADAVVRRNKADNNGHAMMIVTVNIVKTDNGAIDGTRSYVTVLEQTSGHIEQQQAKFDSELGENVYTTYLIDKKYTFTALYSEGYMPITCKELIDPSPVEEVKVTDSATESKDIFEGALTATRFISAVTVTITDSEGNILQQCAGSPVSRDAYTFDMQTFVDDRPEVLRGKLDLAALEAGTYHCTVNCRLVTGDNFTMRDFDFDI